MSSFKSLLDEISRRSASLAFQGSGIQDFSVTGSTTTFVAPFDGYAVAVASGYANTDAINLSCGGVQVFTPSYLGSWIVLWVPCRKGVDITVRINGSPSTYPILRCVKARLVE